jgi:glycosyltransferase involved in cell wall biosynthesis
MSDPLVTVILIGYNDAARLPRAIESILGQTLHDLELIIVDDASTDSTAEVISEVCQRDSRVKSIRLPRNSGGCSAPRNAGLDAARGSYVMFADSDDEYEKHACMNLLSAAEEWGADLVCGTAVRVVGEKGERVRWRPELHSKRLVVNSLNDCTDLLYDTIAVNKIYRRDFLNSNSIRFPEGVLFEDQPFTLQCFLRARIIGVIPEDVYYWYVTKASASITQSRHERRNLEDRLTVNRLMDELIGSNSAIKEAKEEKFLRHEAYLYLSTIASADEQTARELMGLLVPYIAEQSVESFDALRPLVRVAMYGLLTDDLNLLRSAMRYENWASVVDSVLVREAGRTFWRAPDETELMHRSSRYWLDVTSMQLLGIPFSQRRYLHVVQRMEPTSAGIDTEITTVDFASDLESVNEATVVLSASKGRRWELQLRRVSESAGVITWRGSGHLSSNHVLRSELGGWVGIAITLNGIENLTAVRALSPVGVQVGHVDEIWGGSEAIDFAPADRAGVTWHASGRTRSLGSAFRRLRARSHHTQQSPERVELPADRLAVVLAMEPRRGLGPASSTSVELSAWIKGLGDRTYLLVVQNSADPNFADPIAVPTRMRGCVRSISVDQFDELITGQDAIALVCGDATDALNRAHAHKIPVLKFRPQRGALEYGLDPIDAMEYANTLEQLVAQAESVLFGQVQSP